MGEDGIKWNQNGREEYSEKQAKEKGNVRQYNK